MMNKRVIAIFLIIGIIVSSLNVLFVSPVTGSDIKTGIPFIDNFSAKKQPGVVLGDNKQPDFEKLKTEKNKEIEVKLPEQDKVLYNGVIKSSSKDQADNALFDYTQDDLEKLLTDGYSMEDIFKAGEVGNRILEDPKKLLEEKRSSNKEWADVEKAVENERKQDYLNKMQQKYPDVYAKFVKENLSQSDMSLIFAYVNNYEVKSIDSLINEYKTKGKEALVSNKANKKNIVTKEKMDEYGLSPQDVEGLSDEMIDRVAIMSQESNISVKDLLKQLNTDRHNVEVKK